MEQDSFSSTSYRGSFTLTSGISCKGWIVLPLSAATPPTPAFSLVESSGESEVFSHTSRI